MKVEPPWALPGARVALVGGHFPLPAEGPPHVLIGTRDARVVAATPRTIRIVVPADAPGGSSTIRVDELPGDAARVEIGAVIATDVHQVDSPIFDRAGRL